MSKIDAFYLPFAGGGRFSLLHTPSDTAPAGAVLYVHPFAEEMNKSRRMAAMQARALADQGWAVLQIDLFGCGDSAGDFADASWERWVQDVIEAVKWLKAELGHPPILWGLRTGCLLLAQAAQKLESATDFLLWQPVISGKQFLQQFLRLRAVSLGGAESEQRTGTQMLREQLARGEGVEVAGYMLKPALAFGMESAELRVPDTHGRIMWLEVSGSMAGGIAPASHVLLEKWRNTGRQVEAGAVEGARFWQTVEISECPALISATLSAVAARGV